MTNATPVPVFLPEDDEEEEEDDEEMALPTAMTIGVIVAQTIALPVQAANKFSSSASEVKSVVATERFTVNP
jgi:hypothetical protein